MTDVVSFAVEDTAPEALDEAMLAWWRALVEHAKTQTDADLLVADAWAETGRLIGLVQKSSEPVGTDRGVRVVLTVRSLASAASESGAASSVVASAREALFSAFERSRRKLVLDGFFTSLWDGKANCYYCEDGCVIADPSLVARPKPMRKSRKE